MRARTEAGLTVETPVRPRIRHERNWRLTERLSLPARPARRALGDARDQRRHARADGEAGASGFADDVLL